jgi:hypothetical protein
MKKMIAFALVALLALPVAASAQVMYVQAGPLGGALGPQFEIGAGAQFNVAVSLDTFGEGSSAAEFVMTELLVVAPGVFKLGTVKVNNTPLDLGDNAVGEYVLSFQGCVAGGAPVTMVTLTYGTFGGVPPADTVLQLRGLQPGDSVGSTFGGEPGYIDCADGGFVAQMGGQDGGFTGNGTVFPDGSCVINGTPLVVDTDASSVGSLKARF